MKQISVLIAFLLIGIGSSFAQNVKDTTHKATDSSAHFTCSMHPEVKSQKAGKCPKCGMALVAIKNKKDKKASNAMKM